MLRTELAFLDIVFIALNSRDYKNTFRFLLQARDTEAARHYLMQLQFKYGAEKRWAIFEKKYKDILAEAGLL